jgi:hypothetical protein
VSNPISAETRRKLLAGYLERTRGARTQADDSIPLRPAGMPVEASEAQQQLWLHSELAGQAPLYNEPVTIYFNGELDVAAMEAAFNEILRRHEAWRTSFVWRDDKLLQVIAPEVKMELPLIDLRKLSTAKREGRAREIAIADAKAPFDFGKAPLIRCRLFRLQDTEYRLYLTLHHIIFDAVSMYHIFLPELQTLYAACVKGEDPALKPVSVQYADYSHWQRQWLTSGGADEQLRYWKDALSGDLPELPLPLDRPRSISKSYAGDMVTFAIPAGTTTRLNEIAQAAKATLNATALSAFHILLYHYTGACDQSVGTASSSRKHLATMEMMGLFLNTVVLRTKVVPDEPFTALLARVQATTWRALSNDDIPFSRVVSEVDRTRKEPHRPLFQVMFSLQPPLPPLAPEWGFTQMDISAGVSKFDLHLEIDEREEGLIGRVIYSTDLFDEKTIRGMLETWRCLIDFIVEAPNQSVSQLLQRIDALRLKPSSGPTSLLEKLQRIWY